MQLQQEEQARRGAPGAGGGASGTAAGTRGNAGAGTGAYPRAPVAGAGTRTETGVGVGAGVGVGPQSGAARGQYTGSPARGASHGSAFSRYQQPHPHQPSSQRTGRGQHPETGTDESVCLQLQILNVLVLYASYVRIQYRAYEYNILVLRTCLVFILVLTRTYE